MNATSAPKDSMPAGIGNAYLFQIFNTWCWNICLGAPMLLFFKKLGASNTVLAMVAASNPLLNILQIPAARFVEQVGYRAFVLRGWSARSIFIFGMVVVAILPTTVDTTTRITLMLFVLIGFNILRGISVCGFLPWLTHLVPENVRGHYLSREQICVSIAAVSSSLLVAGFLHWNDSLGAFGGLFFFSFMSALTSLFFLKRIPDVPVTPSMQNREHVPWGDMLRYAPFQRLLICSFVMHTAFAAGAVFWIPMFKDQFHLSDGQTMMISAFSGIFAAGAYAVFGRIIDRVGSRPLMAFGVMCISLHFLGWATLAAGFLPFNVWTVAWQQVIGALGGSLFTLSLTRLAMATVPVMGRSHFFAIFSVVNSLTLGLMPLPWGLVLDSLKHWHYAWGYWQWNKFSVLYIWLTLTLLVSQFFIHRLTEAKAMTTEAFLHELLVTTPARALSRLITRRQYP
jgi:MFS family permease